MNNFRRIARKKVTSPMQLSPKIYYPFDREAIFDSQSRSILIDAIICVNKRWGGGLSCEDLENWIFSLCLTSATSSYHGFSAYQLTHLTDRLPLSSY